MSNLSRRSFTVIAGTAVSTVTVTAVPDPIFAAIEQHRATHAAVDAAANLPEDIPAELTDENYQCMCELGETKPTTLEGVIAIMRYRRELQETERHTLFAMEGEGGDPRDDITAWLAVIERSLEAITAQS